MFSGTGGSGVKDMPSEHSKVMTEKCITCHIYKGKEKTEKVYGHTFQINDKVCLHCHEETKILMLGWRERITPLAEQLKELLDNYPDKRSGLYIAANRNYTLVITDGGVGIHNPRYAQELLKNSILLLRSGNAESTWSK